MAPAEQTLRLELRGEELDFNDYYGVIENPLDRSSAVDALVVDLDVATEGTRTVALDTTAWSATVEVRVSAERP
ncbi:MAG: hypothetical protein R3F62_18560 [Planctomycetota bacterium]